MSQLTNAILINYIETNVTLETQVVFSKLLLLSDKTLGHKVLTYLVRGYIHLGEIQSLVEVNTENLNALLNKVDITYAMEHLVGVNLSSNISIFNSFKFMKDLLLDLFLYAGNTLAETPKMLFAEVGFIAPDGFSYSTQQTLQNDFNKILTEVSFDNASFKEAFPLDVSTINIFHSSKAYLFDRIYKEIFIGRGFAEAFHNVKPESKVLSMVISTNHEPSLLVKNSVFALDLLQDTYPSVVSKRHCKYWMLELAKNNGELSISSLEQELETCISAPFTTSWRERLNFIGITLELLIHFTELAEKDSSDLISQRNDLNFLVSKTFKLSNIIHKLLEHSSNMTVRNITNG
jgi:hypothetical protein